MAAPRRNSLLRAFRAFGPDVMRGWSSVMSVRMTDDAEPARVVIATMPMTKFATAPSHDQRGRIAAILSVGGSSRLRLRRRRSRSATSCSATRRTASPSPVAVARPTRASPRHGRSGIQRSRAPSPGDSWEVRATLDLRRVTRQNGHPALPIAHSGASRADGQDSVGSICCQRRAAG
jgi:hypothetical protein